MLRGVYTGSSLDTLTWLPAVDDGQSWYVTEGTKYWFRMDGYGFNYFGTLKLAWDTFGSWQEDGVFTVTGPDWAWHEVFTYEFATDETSGWPAAYGTQSYLAAPARGWDGYFVYDYSTGGWSGINYIRRYGLAISSPAGRRRSFLRPETTGAGPRANIQPLQGLVVASSGGGWQELLYNFATEALEITPFALGAQLVDVSVPEGQFVGGFHYDYISGRYRQLDLRFRVR